MNQREDEREGWPVSLTTNETWRWHALPISLRWLHLTVCRHGCITWCFTVLWRIPGYTDRQRMFNSVHGVELIAPVFGKAVGTKTRCLSACRLPYVRAASHICRAAPYVRMRRCMHVRVDGLYSARRSLARCIL